MRLVEIGVSVAADAPDLTVVDIGVAPFLIAGETGERGPLASLANGPDGRAGDRGVPRAKDSSGADFLGVSSVLPFPLDPSSLLPCATSTSRAPSAPSLALLPPLPPPPALALPAAPGPTVHRLFAPPAPPPALGSPLVELDNRPCSLSLSLCRASASDASWKRLMRLLTWRVGVKRSAYADGRQDLGGREQWKKAERMLQERHEAESETHAALRLLYGKRPVPWARSARCPLACTALPIAHIAPPVSGQFSARADPEEDI